MQGLQKSTKFTISSSTEPILDPISADELEISDPLFRSERGLKIISISLSSSLIAEYSPSPNFNFKSKFEFSSKNLDFFSLKFSNSDVELKIWDGWISIEFLPIISDPISNADANSRTRSNGILNIGLDHVSRPK